MKIRELKRKVNGTDVPVWPPSWVGSYGPGQKMAVGEVGTLKSVKRIGNRLSLTNEYDGREHVGSLEWDQPPTIAAVETLLTANLGQEIKAIGALDI